MARLRRKDAGREERHYFFTLLSNAPGLVALDVHGAARFKTKDQRSATIRVRMHLGRLPIK